MGSARKSKTTNIPTVNTMMMIVASRRNEWQQNFAQCNYCRNECCENGNPKYERPSKGHGYPDGIV